MAKRGPNDDPITGLQGESIRELARNTRTIQSNIDSIETLNSSFRANLDVVGKFTAVVQKAEQLNLQSLAAGTTFAKFTNQNTEALKGNISTNLEMTAFLMGGFQKGLRDVGRNTADLADDMMLTGQTTDGLIGVLGGLTLLTSDSNKSQSKLSKSILKNTANYGITATSMIQALNAVKASLEAASVYGNDAVDAYADSAASLKAAMGGGEGSDKTISVLLGMADSLNVGQQEQLGLTKIMSDLRAGNQINHSELVSAGLQLRATLTDNAMVAQSITNQYGAQQVEALLHATNALMKGNKLTEEMKSAEQDKLNTITAQQKNIDKFYETLAPELYSVTSKNLPAIAISVGALKGTMGKWAANAFTNTGTGRAASPGVAPIGKLGKLARFGGGALALLGPIGIGMSILSVALPAITGLMKGTEKNTEETTKQLKDKNKKDIERVFTSSTLSKAASLASGMLRQGSTGNDSQKLIRVLERQIRLQEAANASLRTIADGDPNPIT